MYIVAETDMAEGMDAACQHNWNRIDGGRKGLVEWLLVWIKNFKNMGPHFCSFFFFFFSSPGTNVLGEVLSYPRRRWRRWRRQFQVKVFVF